jgi:hypothetical protein
LSEWRRETAGDLADAASRLESLLGSISGEPSSAQLLSAWRAYVAVEKSVAFIKTDLDEENPGRFIKPRSYSVPDERQALQFALRHLKKGSESFALGDFVLALRDLREARNYLRALLREKNLQKARKGRVRRG